MKKQLTLVLLSGVTLLALAGCRKKRVCCQKQEETNIEYREDAQRISGVYDPEVNWEPWEKEQYTR